MSQYKPGPPSCCSPPPSDDDDEVSVTSTLAGLKLYQALIFSLPVVFTFVLLFVFYLFYLRRRRADWASLRMRTPPFQGNDVVVPSRFRFGLKKELREMLPIIVYKESFYVRDTQCPVCLGDYQAEDRLQQIPACGHTFHMDCIDHWLANHTTCPLCRLSLLASSKLATDIISTDVEAGQEVSAAGNDDGQPPDLRMVCEGSGSTPLTELRNQESRAHENSAGEDERRFRLQNDVKEDTSQTRNAAEEVANS